MIDAGTTADTEVFTVSEAELQALPTDEWALFQRLVREPVTLANTSIEVRQGSSTRDAAVLYIWLVREVPCVTTLR